MSRTLLTIALSACIVAFGCEDEEENGPGGSGGMGGEGGIGGGGPASVEWTASGVSVIDDACDFFINPDTGDAFFEGEMFIMEVDGSTVTLQLADSALVLSTDTYQVGDNTVILTSTTDRFEEPDCEVEIMEQVTLELADPEAGLEGNQVLSAEWFHNQFDVSMIQGACSGVWFVDLPCVSEADLMLTQ
jgi:hypothetical protein